MVAAGHSQRRSREEGTRGWIDLCAGPLYQNGTCPFLWWAAYGWTEYRRDTGTEVVGMMSRYYTGKHALRYNQRWRAYSERTLREALAMIDLTALRAGAEHIGRRPRVL